MALLQGVSMSGGISFASSAHSTDPRCIELAVTGDN
jgi:hypothetical protein